MPGKLAFSQPVVIKWECEHHDADIHVHSSASPAEGAQVMMWQNARVIPVAKWDCEHDA